MHWSDERYVRVFVRDSLTWKLWSWESRSLFILLLRKSDRAGVIDIGEHTPARAAAAIAEMPINVVKIALPPILESGTLEVGEGALVFPNFIEAQEAKSSDAQRQRESRGRRRALKRAKERGHDTEQADSDCDDGSQNVTDSHTESHGVTLNRTTPSLATLKDGPGTKAPGKNRATKKVSPTPKPPSDDGVAIAQYLYDAIERHTPGHLGEMSPQDVVKRLTAWARQVDGALAQRGTVQLKRNGERVPPVPVSVEDMRAIIDYAHDPSDPSRNGNFSWHDNLRSGASLREQAGRGILITQARRWAGKGRRGVPDFDFSGARDRLDGSMKKR